MNRILRAFAALCVATLGTSAGATTFVEQEFVCPIGGEKFKDNVVASNSSFGQRPDGRPYSSLPVYPMVECPENGFLLFDEDFTDEELKILEAAIATHEYEVMRKSDTQHYRVWWLKDKAGRDRMSQISSLLQASWETDGDRERKIKYQAAFANLTMELERTEDNASGWFWLNMRAVNALRELGHFLEGLKRLDFVTRTEHLPTDPEELENAAYFAGELRELLEQENFIPEPANLVPVDIAMFRCAAPQLPLTAVEREACEGDEIATAIAEFEFKPEGGKKLIGKEAIIAAEREWREAE